MRKATERDPGRGKEQALDPIQRFKVAQRQFVIAAGRFDLDRYANLRVAEARRQMSSAGR
jgi:hypothetical protein